MHTGRWLAEVVTGSFVGIRNRCGNPINVSNMIMLVISTFDFGYELRTGHVFAGVIIMEPFVSSGA